MTGEQDLRVYLAAERTFLAWLRTGLALMGFGFVVERFGLLLRELQVGVRVLAGSDASTSLHFGLSLLVLGVVVNAFATIDYIVLVRRLRRGDEVRLGPSRVGLFVALATAVLGGAMGVYLVALHRT